MQQASKWRKERQKLKAKDSNLYNFLKDKYLFLFLYTSQALMDPIPLETLPVNK